MIQITETAGGGSKFFRLYFLWTWVALLFCAIGAGQPPYYGAINYFDAPPNDRFILDADGNLTITSSFTEGEWRFWLDPTGNLMVGYDSDYEITKTMKWYRIEGDSLVESSQQLPSPYSSPVVWTPRPFRAIVGHYPIRVWNLNPVSLQATMLSEYLDTEAVGDYAALIPDLGYLYLNVAVLFDLRRVNYDDSTGVVSGPVTTLPTPHRGNMDMIQTSDGRLIVQLSSSDYLTIFHVEEDGSLTVTQDNDLYWQFNIANVHRAAISPDDRFLFVIARDLNNVNSFDLATSGTITPITQLTGFDLAQALAITPDGKFLAVAHNYYYGYPAAILSVFAIGDDGSLTYLSGKDVPLSAMPIELAFFPPPTALPTAAKNWTFYW